MTLNLGWDNTQNKDFLKGKRRKRTKKIKKRRKKRKNARKR